MDLYLCCELLRKGYHRDFQTANLSFGYLIDIQKDCQLFGIRIANNLLSPTPPFPLSHLKFFQPLFHPLQDQYFVPGYSLSRIACPPSKIPITHFRTPHLSQQGDKLAVHYQYSLCVVKEPIIHKAQLKIEAPLVSKPGDSYQGFGLISSIYR